MEKVNNSKKLTFSVQTSDDAVKHIHGDTIDELIDAIEVLKDVNFIKKFLKEFQSLSKSQLNRLEQIVLNLNNIDEIYEYAIYRKDSLIYIAEFEDLLIKSGDNARIVEFARDVKGANIEKLEEAIIRSKDKRAIISFYRWIKGSNSAKIKEALFEGEKDAKAIYEFIMIKKAKGYVISIEEIKEADEVIIASRKAEVCTLWASHMEGIDIAKNEEVVIQEKKDAYIYEFAKYVKGANIEKLEDAYIECASAYGLRKFATEVKDCNIRKLEDAIIKKGDASEIYWFARNIEGANLYKLRKALKEKKDEYYLESWKRTFGMRGLFKINF